MVRHTLHFKSYQPAIRFLISQNLLAHGWHMVNQPELAAFSDKHLTLDDKVSILLEYKHLCALLIQRFCPHISPETFALNDINYRQVIENLWYHKKAKKPWVLKPSLLNNGDYIVLFNNMKEVVDYYINHQRLPGDHVLQRYIEHPDLWEGRKYTFRLPGVLTNDRGVYLHKRGYMNISALPYKPGFENAQRRIHVTNYILNGDFAGITQLTTDDHPQFQKLYPKLCRIVAQVVKAVCAVYPDYLAQKSHPSFEIFGFDFILDKHKRPFLLEVNQGPDFPMLIEHPLNEALWRPFWQSVVDEFVLPIADQTPFQGPSAFAQILSYHQATHPGRWSLRKGRKFKERFEDIIKIQKDSFF